MAEPKLTVARNWKGIYDDVLSAIDYLKFDAATELTPRAKIIRANKKLANASAVLQKNSITRLGRFKIRFELTSVSNKLKGIDHGLEERVLSEKRCNQITAESISALQLIATELIVHADRELQQSKISDYNAQHNEVVKAQEKLSEEDTEKPKVKETIIMKDMQQAMKKLRAEQSVRDQESLARMKQHELAAMEAGLKFHKPPQSTEIKDTWVMRDEQAINNVVKGFEKDKDRIQKEIEKSGILTKKDIGYTLITGPVLIRCSVPIRDTKLKASGVKYTILSFPPVKLGGDPVNPGGGKRESISPLIILQDQVLIVFGKNIIKFKPPEKLDPANARKPSIKRKEAPSTGPINNENLNEIRKDLLAIIESRKGAKYLDVLQELGGTAARTITSKALPGVRIVWFIRQSIYNKIGPFTLDEVGMPF
jgi:hypothetical protein